MVLGFRVMVLRCIWCLGRFACEYTTPAQTSWVCNQGFYRGLAGFVVARHRSRGEKCWVPEDLAVRHDPLDVGTLPLKMCVEVFGLRVQYGSGTSYTYGSWAS